MFSLVQKMEYVKSLLKTDKDLSGRKVVFINEQGEIIGGDAVGSVNEEMIHAHRGKVSGAGLKAWFMESKNRVADKMISLGVAGQTAILNPDGFFADRRANGDAKGIMVLIVGAVVVIKLASTMLPQASSDWSAATAAGGAMENASTSDKSTWNTGGSLIPVFGLLIIAGMAMRAF